MIQTGRFNASFLYLTASKVTALTPEAVLLNTRSECLIAVSLIKQTFRCEVKYSTCKITGCISHLYFQVS